MLSWSRGQGYFRGLEASRPRPRPMTWKCVLEAKDVLEDSISANYVPVGSQCWACRLIWFCLFFVRARQCVLFDLAYVIYVSDRLKSTIWLTWMSIPVVDFLLCRDTLLLLNCCERCWYNCLIGEVYVLTLKNDDLLLNLMLANMLIQLSGKLMSPMWRRL